MWKPSCNNLCDLFQTASHSNFLVLSLAVADLLVGLLVFPLNMVFTVTLCLFQRSIFCDVRNFFDTLLCISSILNLCCISIDRYYAVCQPLTYRTKINNRVVVVMILVIWGAATVISMIRNVSGSNTCDDEICLIYKKVANFLILVLALYLPVIIMLCIYLKIFLVAQKQAHSIQNTKSGATVSKMERKATKTLAVVMGVFLLCWLPYFLCISILASRKVRVPLPVTETLIWVSLSNSMLNPFIYAFFFFFTAGSNQLLN
ncbi:trace amine-associated receptor 1-like [Thalassophryne amazonica]|uniref:trace amine-associated receptor 1-like n=1 Tax=Thalassophryne amazonica TaxID=390379 RepID=UPI00147122BF|nr:trace amine-associated receptor 1-like [Thalassophryne amazonica]